MPIVLNGQTNDVTINGVSVATESEAILKTGNETIAGVKTFSSSPIVPTPTTGDNSTKVATTAFVKSKSEADSIGVGQTWQDVTASRASGVTYTNSTGKPIQVAVEAASAASGSTFTINGVAQSRYILGCNYIVPNGATYSSVPTSGLAKWVELR